MFRFGRKSKKCLNELDERLADIARLMMKKQVMDFAIICGYRNEAEQNAAFAVGTSKVKYPDSKHNTNPAQAYDRVPFPIPLNAAGEWDDKSPLWDKLAALERQCAKELNIKISQGCAWKFKDLPHCQLEE